MWVAFVVIGAVLIYVGGAIRMAVKKNKWR
jgi:hypothetical protein